MNVNGLKEIEKEVSKPEGDIVKTDPAATSEVTVTTEQPAKPKKKLQLPKVVP